MIHVVADAAEFVRAFLKRPTQTSQAPSDFPRPLREFYEAFDTLIGTQNHAGANSRLFQAQDSVFHAREARRTNDRIVFLIENQGCWTCEASLGAADDSPVWLRDDEEHLLEVQLSQFIITVMLYESVMAARWLANCEDLPTRTHSGSLDLIWSSPYAWGEADFSFWANKKGTILALGFAGAGADWFASNEEGLDEELQGARVGWLARGP